MASNDQLEQYKQKYASVLSMIQQQQVQLSHLHVQDNRLFMQGTAPSDAAKNKVWDQIKLVNPNWDQDLVADITVNSNSAFATASASGQGSGEQGNSARSYTVQAGDSLSKISKQFYGNANEYMKIFDANRDTLNDPNMIKPGQTLKIPA